MYEPSLVMISRGRGQANQHARVRRGGHAACSATHPRQQIVPSILSNVQLRRSLSRLGEFAVLSCNDRQVAFGSGKPYSSVSSSLARSSVILGIRTTIAMDTGALDLSGINLNLTSSQRLAAEKEVEHTGLISLLQFKVWLKPHPRGRVMLTDRDVRS